METKSKILVAAIALKKISAKILKKADGVDFEASLDVLDDALSVLDEASALMDGAEEAKVASEQVDGAWVKVRDLCRNITNFALGFIRRDMIEVTDLIDQALEYLEMEAGVKAPSCEKGK